MCENCIRKKWCRDIHCPSHNLINFGNLRKQDRMTCLYRSFEDAMACATNAVKRNVYAKKMRCNPKEVASMAML